MIRVVVESPLAGDRAKNKRYARLCLLDCLQRQEAPFASHLLYDDPDVLDDEIQIERDLGIAAGFAWGEVAHRVVVYQDLGISAGMRAGIARAQRAGQVVEYRHLPSSLMGRFTRETIEDVARSRS